MSRIVPSRLVDALTPAITARLFKQKGVIVSCGVDNGNESLIYSPESGHSIIPIVSDSGVFCYTMHAIEPHLAPLVTATKEWKLGAVVEYDSVRSSEGLWIAVNMRLTGKVLRIVPYLETAETMFSITSAIVTRVEDDKAWIWSDDVGRIYARGFTTRDSENLSIFNVVNVSVLYDPGNSWKHGGEDVPWTAVALTAIRYDAPAVGALLRSSKLKFGGDWKLKVVPTIQEMGYIAKGNLVAYMDYRDFTDADAISSDEDAEQIGDIHAVYVKQAGMGTTFYRAVAVWEGNPCKDRAGGVHIEEDRALADWDGNEE